MGTPSPMTPERWRQVKAIVSAAMDRPRSEHAKYVDDACAADVELRRDVESLLADVLRDDDGETHDVEELAQDLIASAAYEAFSQASRDSLTLLDDLQLVLGSDYRIDKELGGGGMSRVFLGAEVALDDRAIVVKVLKPEHAEGASAERFAREVRFAARLQQANIVPVLRVGEVRNLAFYIMPYHGNTLRERIASGERPTTADALDVLKNVAKALACAHSEGVVHRDIKPENILLSGGTPVVADFGIAKMISSLREPPVPNDVSTSDVTTMVGTVIGTPAYMAPEQAAGDSQIGPPADIYALGIVAYELLAGAHPFGHISGAQKLMAAQITEKPRPLSEYRSDVSPTLIGLVTRCLEKDPVRRPQNGVELLSALKAIEAMTLGVAPTAGDMSEIKASIAVLPFACVEAENELLSDGIAEGVLNALTRMRGLRVAARTSAWAFKGKSPDPRTVARDLDVETVLQGSVNRAGDRVEIGVDLNDADGLHIWGAEYARQLADIFAVQEELAHAVASTLEEKLVRERRSARAITAASRSRQRTVDSDAYQLYLTGRSLLEQRCDGMQRGLECLQKATRLAPEFSDAHAAISMAYTLFGVYNILRPREAFPMARSAAERALAINPEDVLAIVMRAHTALWHEWDFHAAESRARRALALAPSSHLAHECLGYVLAAQRRFDESIDAMERGRSLDPISENATYDLAWVLLLSGRWEQAIRELEPALAKYPRMSELRRVYGFCLFYAGRVKEARAEFERVLELNVGDRWGSLNLGQALAASEKVDEARRHVAELEERASREPIPAFGIAVIHHCLGDDEAALTWLDKSIEARDYWLVMARDDPSLIRLRDHPEFDRKMRRVHALASPVPDA